MMVDDQSQPRSDGQELVLLRISVSISSEMIMNGLV